MKNYELLIAIALQKNELVQSIEDSFNKVISKLQTNFTIDEIENLGWVKTDFYPAGYEHIYTKNGRHIYVGYYSPYILVRPGSGFPKQIYDYEHLEDYANGLV